MRSIDGTRSQVCVVRPLDSMALGFKVALKVTLQVALEQMGVVLKAPASQNTTGTWEHHWRTLAFDLLKISDQIYDLSVSILTKKSPTILRF